MLLHALNAKAYEFYIFCSCFAAIIHDFEHNGVNNDFLVRTSHARALVYNDRSCQENHHLAAAFACLQHPKCDILKSFNEKRPHVRKIAIELVLGTDMSQHNSILSQFRIKLSNGALQLEEEDSLILILKMALKCSDISHTSKEDFLHANWTQRVTDEFYSQGDVERSLGLSVSAFMDRNAPNLGKSQIGFFTFVVEPLFETWTQFLQMPDLPFVQLVASHRRKYERIMQLEEEGEKTDFTHPKQIVQ
eukprot:c6926_g1_i1.p1 GENE.c6926_g1_i1~~c6926_g1_i1.p1  ORF type:complete len:248 (-),score=49.29 c6926_g1_i1:78-821(-)